MRGEVWAAGGGRRRATAVHVACRRGSTADSGQGTGRSTHVEHVLHARDAGGVEAKRLVELNRALPRVEKRAYGAE